MATYLFAYTAGSAARNDEDTASTIASWGHWFTTLGDAVVDAGNPFGPAATVTGDGGVADGTAAGLSGYSLVKADDLAAATMLTKGCPVLADGGTVQIYEAIPITM